MVGFQSVNTTGDVQNFLRPGKDNIPCEEKNYTSVAAAVLCALWQKSNSVQYDKI